MRKIALALVALLLLSAPAAAQSTKAQLNTEVSTNFPDNTTGLITPSILRTTVNDFISSWQQAAAVNAQTGTTYTVLVGDYGKLVTFSNGSAIAVTLPQATGSFSTFNVYVRNLGAGAVTITPATSTINGAATLVLATGQAAWIISDGTNYQTWINGAVARQRLASPLTLYASASGSGTACTSGTPCTIAQAISALNAIDAAGNKITIQLADGTYTAANVAILSNVIGGIAAGDASTNQLTIQGNCTTPANVVVNGTSGSAFTLVGIAYPVAVTCLTITSTTSGHGIQADFGSRVYYSKIVWGAMAAGYSHAVATYGSMIEQEGTETISGNAALHWYADRGSQILTTGQTVTCTGSPAFSSAFVGIYNGSNFALNGAAFSGCGTVTGTKYLADYTSSFGAGTADPNTLYPGNANGSVTLPSFGLTGVLLGNGGPFTGTNQVTALAASNGSLLVWSGTTLTNLTSAVNSTLITDGIGIPSISQTLPTAVQNNIAITNLTGTLAVGNGGTGTVGFTAHGLPVGQGGGAFTVTNAGINGQLLLGRTGADPAFATMSQDCAITNAGVITCTKTNNVAFAASATTDATNATNISSGTLGVARGGTNLASYAVGDIIYADGATSLAKLADVATGNALISGGVTTAPAWGKISLTTHISGTLPVANGGTGDTGTAWAAYTPTVTCTTSGTITSDTVSGAYKTIGKTVFVRANVNISTLGTCLGNLSLTLPTANTSAVSILSALNGSTNVSVPAYANAAAILILFGAAPAANSYYVNGVYDLP